LIVAIDAATLHLKAPRYCSMDFAPSPGICFNRPAESAFPFEGKAMIRLRQTGLFPGLAALWIQFRIH